MHFEFDNPEIADAFEVLFRGFFKATWFWWRVWILVAELRIMIQMFLNINPYFEPFLTLWAWTNPVFTFGRTLYPKFFGLDLTPIVNYKILQYVEKYFDRFAHGIDDYNYYKFGLTSSKLVDGITVPNTNSYDINMSFPDDLGISKTVLEILNTDINILRNSLELIHGI